MPECVLVVPCFNEMARLDVSAFERFARTSPGVTLLFVDDGSTDATAEMLDGLAERHPDRCAVLRLELNQGKAQAVRLGMLRAFELGPRYAGYWDADLATPLEALEEFRQVLDAHPDLEMVLGARVQLLGRSIRRRVARHYLGRVFATAASLALGLAVYDTQCGAKLFRVTPAVRELFREPFIAHWVFDVEVLARLVRQRRGGAGPRPQDVIYELPLQRWHDVPGSKVRAVDFPRALAQVAQIWHRYLRPGLPHGRAPRG